MSRITILILLLISLLLVGCGTAPAPTPTPANSGGDDLARPTPTDQPSEQAPEGYPPPPPTAEPLPEGYPAPAVLPTYDPYPADGGAMWILYPVGLQCEEPGASQYQTEQDALSALTAAGLTVRQITTIELMVCEACGCPTSAHYRAEINAADANKAAALGWTPE